MIFKMSGGNNISTTFGTRCYSGVAGLTGEVVTAVAAICCGCGEGALLLCLDVKNLFFLGGAGAEAEAEALRGAPGRLPAKDEDSGTIASHTSSTAGVAAAAVRDLKNFFGLGAEATAAPSEDPEAAPLFLAPRSEVKEADPHLPTSPALLLALMAPAAPFWHCCLIRRSKGLTPRPLMMRGGGGQGDKKTLKPEDESLGVA